MDEAPVPQLHRLGDSAEQKLLAQVACGKQDALVALYRCYQRPLFVYLLRMVRDADLAEEVLQDVLLAIWQSAATYAGRSRVTTWVFGIAHHQAVQAMRRRRFQLVPPEECEDLGDGAQDSERMTFTLAMQEDLWPRWTHCRSSTARR